VPVMQSRRRRGGTVLGPHGDTAELGHRGRFGKTEAAEESTRERLGSEKGRDGLGVRVNRATELRPSRSRCGLIQSRRCGF
jgi:hypothetical protein